MNYIKNYFDDNMYASFGKLKCIIEMKSQVIQWNIFLVPF